MRQENIEKMRERRKWNRKGKREEKQNRDRHDWKGKCNKRTRKGERKEGNRK